MSQNEALTITAYVGNVLTIMGGLFILSNYCLLYLYKKRPSNTHQRLVVTYAIISIIAAAGGILFNALDHSTSRTVCVMQTLHITFWNLASWFFSTLICLNILIVIQPELKYRIPDSFPQFPLDIVYHAVGWGLSILLICIVAGFHKDFTNTGPWCWIAPTRPALRFGAFYGWSIASSILNIIIFILLVVVLVKKARAVSNDKTAKMALKVGLRMALYVVVFVLCWVFGTANRIGQTANSSFYNFPLMWIHTFLSISTGFWISIIFGFAEKIHIEYYNLFCGRKAQPNTGDSFVYSEEERAKLKQHNTSQVAVPMTTVEPKKEDEETPSSESPATTSECEV